MGAMASQITSLTIVYSTIYSGTDKTKHENSASLAFVRGIHQSPVNSPHRGPVTWKMFSFDDVMMICVQFQHITENSRCIYVYTMVFFGIINTTTKHMYKEQVLNNHGSSADPFGSPQFMVVKNCPIGFYNLEFNL